MWVHDYCSVKPDSNRKVASDGISGFVTNVTIPLKLDKALMEFFENRSHMDDKLRILLVDDHPEVLHQIKQLVALETRFEICESPSVENAIEHIDTCKPDIMLIDPYVNDRLCLSSLKKIKAVLPNITIVVLTAVVDTSAHMELSRLGVEYILEKQLASEQLIDTLREVAKTKYTENQF